MDGACPPPAAGAPGSPQATFQDCLRQIAKAHEQELQQLAAENRDLRQQLESLRRAQGGAAQGGEPPSAGDRLGESRSCWAQAEESTEGQALLRSAAVPSSGERPVLPGAIAREPMEDHAPRPELPSAVVPPSGEQPVLPGAIATASAELTFADPMRPSPGRVTIAEAEAKAGVAEAEAGTAGSAHSGSETESELGFDGTDTFPLTEGWGVATSPSKRKVSLTGMTRRATRLLGSSAAANSKYVSSPSDPGRAVWDTVGAGLIFWDLWAIPLQQSFNLTDTKFLTGMDWTTLVYWTVDIPMTLQVGFVQDGEVVKVPLQIASRYFKTWFFVDLLVVVNDWLSNLNAFASANHDGTVSGLKFLRVLRLARLLRLVRILRLARIVQRLNVFIQSERTNIFVNIVKMIVLLMVIVHYVCCVWFLISDSQDVPNTWVKIHDFDSEFWGYQYMVAFHWALTQFTPASMHVQPQNMAERIFAVLVVMFGLVGFSYVVGSITGSLGQLRSLSEETQKQFWTVRRFLRENDVPLELAARITRYLEREWEARRRTVQLKDHKIFSLLSEQLRSELCLGIWMPILRKHALLSELAENQSRCLPRLATTAMELKVFAEGDHIFCEGKASFMYIRVVGDLTYERRNHALVEVSRPCHVFISEPILWTPAWRHLGVLTADIYAQLIRLDPEKFMSIMSESPTSLAAAGRYGRAFVQELRGMSKGQLSDISEVVVGPHAGHFLQRKSRQGLQM